MSKRSFRIALCIVVTSVAVAAVVGAVIVSKAVSYPERERAGSGEEIIVPVERGMTFARVAERLHDRKVIDNPTYFRLYAMYRGVTDKVRVGDYVLRDDMTPEQVLGELLEGVKDVTVAVTIPEGIHMLEVFDIVAEAGVAGADELEALARDRSFLDEQGVPGETAEGFLFPETYRFKVPTPASKVLARLIRQHRVIWDQVRRDNAKRIEKLRDELGWSDWEILVMASIVEKEAVVDQERPRIAQVFINRLTSPKFSPKRLETDPTIRYGCTVPTDKSAPCKDWDPSKRLRTAQLRDKDNPYNTYQHEGLPPGPICNPGREALEATVKPDGSRFFYFVARNDGTHVFSRTLGEHERNVDKYQR